MRKLLILLALGAVVAGIGTSFALARGSSVAVTDNAFSKGTVTIHKGGSVTWRWSGTGNRHNITAIKGGKFHSKTQRSGSYTHKFRKRGTYTIICSIHSRVMRMKVRVL